VREGKRGREKGSRAGESGGGERGRRAGEG
jgi:hypothetical protein